MGFPTVAGTTASFDDTFGTAHSVSIPAPAAGDLLLLFLTNINASTISSTGFTQLSTQLSTGSAFRHTVLYKIASGSEGSSVSAPTSGDSRVSWNTYRITDWHGTTPPEVGTPSTGTSTTPNPPSLNPTGWGTEDTLWLASCAYNFNIAPSYPSSYTGGIRATGGLNYNTSASAQRQLNAASEDPGVFTLTDSTDWAAQTVAIRPVAGISGTGSETAPVAQIAAEGGVYRQSLSWVTIA